MSKNCLSPLLPAFCAGALVSGCHTAARIDAAHDVRAFLRAARDGDNATFEAKIDRPLLEHNLLAQLERRLPDPHDPLAPALVERLVRPATFRLQVQGQSPGDRLPGISTFALALKWLSSGRVCLPATPRRKLCALIFQREGSTWKLVGMGLDAFDGQIRDLKQTTSVSPKGAPSAIASAPHHG